MMYETKKPHTLRKLQIEDKAINCLLPNLWVSEKKNFFFHVKKRAYRLATRVSGFHNNFLQDIQWV